MQKNVKNLDEVVELIDATIQLSDGKNLSSPYFFICGAGISCPEIPTSSQIIELCKNTVEKRYSKNLHAYEKSLQESAALLTSNMKYYSYWIEKAYPNRADRRTFYKELITGSKISSAILLLAQILSSGKISKTVFTTNFDENLERALNLIGTDEVFTADNPRDNLALELESASIQIAHIHGSYRFYDCANLDTEIIQVSMGDEVANVSQSLSFFLQSKAPIIVGYSGWEDDAIMRCLKSRISVPTPYNYIWICHSINDYENLPEWLRSNNCIYFAIPEVTITECSQIEEILLSNKQEKAKFISAENFFAKLIAEFQIAPPILFTNPYLYFSSMINKLIPENEDVFHLRRWADRMQIWGSKETEGERLIIQLETASAKKDYAAVSDLLRAKRENDSWRSPDCTYVYKSIIRPLILSEEIVSDFETLLNFHYSILEFSQNYKVELIETGFYRKALNAAADFDFYKFKKTEGERVISFFKAIEDITYADESLLVLYVKVCRILASVASNKTDEKVYIEKILDTTKDIKDNSPIEYDRVQALVNMIKHLESFDEKLAYLEESMRLAKEIKDTWLDMRILVEKAKLGLKAKKASLRIVMIQEALDEALSFDRKRFCDQILDIIERYQECLFQSKKQMDKSIRNELHTFVVEFIGFSFEYCESRLRYTRLAFQVIDPVTEEALFVDVCKWILTFEDKMPDKCPAYYKEAARFILILLKTDTKLVTSIEKQEYFKKLLSISNTDETIRALVEKIFVPLEIESAKLNCVEVLVTDNYIESKEKEGNS